MPLHADLVGQRVVVRRLLPGQQGPSGGPAMTDVLGILESWGESTLTVRREQGDLVTIDHDLVVTGKPVPPRASTRLRIRPEALERICSEGWRAVDQEPLGEWMLRAAGGFTGRANSARVGGDPGTTTNQALAAVRRFYDERGLRPMAQVVVGSDGQATCESAGWVQARPDGQDAIVQVTSVAQSRRAVARQSSESVAITDTLGDDWMAAYGRTADADPSVVRRVMESGDHVAFARIGDPVVAVGRGVVTGDWMGLQAVEVLPEHRGHGLATTVVDALLSWGASQGALSAYLQTLPDNAAALALYARYGFTTHHSYRYLAPAA
jgi:GNAT superfamily N-acetyltransferase